MKKLTVWLILPVFFITLISSTLYADEQDTSQLAAEILQQANIKVSDIKYNDWQGMLSASNLVWENIQDSGKINVAAQKAIWKNFKITEENNIKHAKADALILQGMSIFLNDPTISMEYEASHLQLNGDFELTLTPEGGTKEKDSSGLTDQITSQILSTVKEAISEPQNGKKTVIRAKEKKKNAGTKKSTPAKKNMQDADQTTDSEKQIDYRSEINFDFSKATLSAIDNTLTIQEKSGDPIYFGFSELKLNTAENSPLKIIADNLFFKTKDGESAYAGSINHSETITELTLPEVFEKLKQIVTDSKKKDKTNNQVNAKALKSIAHDLKIRYIPSAKNPQAFYDVTIAEISNSNSTLTDSHSEFNFNMKDLSVPAIGLAKQFNLEEEYIKPLQAFIKENVFISLGLSGQCNADNKPGTFNINLSSKDLFALSATFNFHMPIKKLPTEEAAFATALTEKALIDSVTFKYDDYNLIPFSTALGAKIAHMPPKMAITIAAGMISALFPKEAALPILDLLQKPGSMSGTLTAKKPLTTGEFFKEDILSKAKLEATTVQGPKTLDECIPAELKK